MREWNRLLHHGQVTRVGRCCRGSLPAREVRAETLTGGNDKKACNLRIDTTRSKKSKD